MGYAPVIDVVVQSLRAFAPGKDERESVEVVNLGQGRRAVGMRYPGGVDARATSDPSDTSMQRWTVQLLQGGASVSEAHGIPPSGVGRVAKALRECLEERGLKITPDEVVATYAEGVRSHQAPGLDTVRAVAEDLHGEAWLEVIDHAYLLGYDLEGREGSGRRMLWQAFRDYQDRLRLELGVDPAALSR